MKYDKRKKDNRNNKGTTKNQPNTSVSPRDAPHRRGGRRAAALVGGACSARRPPGSWPRTAAATVTGLVEEARTGEWEKNPHQQ